MKICKTNSENKNFFISSVLVPDLAKYCQPCDLPPLLAK